MRLSAVWLLKSTGESGMFSAPTFPIHRDESTSRGGASDGTTRNTPA